MKRLFLHLMPGLFLLAGCVQSDGPRNLAHVAGNPFDCPPGSKSAKPNLPPPTTEVAAKVDLVGRKVLAGTPKSGLSPVFVTINSPSVEIFHVDFKQVCVTEGLVKKCQVEEELAAVLASELGKMAVEKATIKALSDPDRGPPSTLTIGSDRNPDFTSLAQLGQYENRTRQSRPNSLQEAQKFLEKAGYPKASLDGVQPILREADRNCALERQFKGLPPQ